MLENYEFVPDETDNFPLRLRRYTGRGWFDIHWHGHTELLYFIKGGVKIYNGGEEFFADDSDMIIVNQNDLHRGNLKHLEVDYFCAMIPERIFDLVGDSDRYIFKKKISKDIKIKNLVYEMYRAYESDDSGSRYICLATAYELIGYMAKNYSECKMNRKEFSERNSRQENFNSIIDYIQMHYSEQLTTADAAKIVHLSEYYFCRLFKKHMGKNFISYLNEIRVHKAANLLRNTKISVTEVADKTGFNDVNYFCRIFKNYIGVPPTIFREQYKDETT